MGPGHETNGVTLGLLGCFELHRAGDPLHLPASAQRLVAFLAIHGRPMLRQHVAFALWEDVPEERAIANLRSALWRARQAGPDLIDPGSSVVQLQPGVRVDLHEARCLTELIIDGGGVDGFVGSWRLLTGDLLPDWTDEWVLLEREYHRNLGLQALETLADELLVSGRLGHALQVALTAVSREPLRESAHRTVVRIHVASGNPSEALRQYHFYRSLAHTHLDLEPSEQMELLVDPLVRRSRAVGLGPLPSVA